MVILMKKISSQISTILLNSNIYFSVPLFFFRNLSFNKSTIARRNIRAFLTRHYREIATGKKRIGCIVSSIIMVFVNRI